MKNRQSFLNRMRFLNKKIFNRVTLKFAGASQSPISVIRHIGRRSGTPYATPVIAVPLVDRFVFALPYGREVDWYRNVLAARKGIIVWHGKEYPIEDPKPLVTRTDLSAFPLALRWIVRIVGAWHFMQMKSPQVIG